MADADGVTLVVDGYRSRQVDGSGPLASLAPDRKIIRNTWMGPGDSLRDRVERLVEWNAALGRSTRVDLLAVSMGCQIAVRIGQDLGRVGDVVLVAPDPKARLGGRDAEEAADGIVSAFEEAQALWGESTGGSPPAAAFTSALVALAPRARRVVVVYCRTDGVSEWTDNVDSFLEALEAEVGIELIEAVDGASITVSGVTVDLSSGGAPDVHERLWSAIRL